MRTRVPQILASLLHVAIVVCVVTSCGSGGDTQPTNPPAATVTAVSVSPASAALVEGDSLALVATATLSDGTTGLRSTTWTSSAPAAATVSANGRVSAVSSGSAVITATIGAASATSTITISRRVATLALDITSRAMLIGETLVLTPALAFSDGTAATGKTLTWNSSTPATATVSAAGVITAIATGTATITATVDGRSAAAALSVRPPSQTTLNTASATSAMIGAAGGVLTTTAAGISYRLEIPANALSTESVIRMTPIVSLTNLPLSGGMVAAVDLQPSGLHFAKAVTLRIGATTPPRAGFTLSGFSLAGATARTEREFAAARANEVVVAIKHFSTAGIGFGTTADLESIPFNYSATSAAERAMSAFLASALVRPPNATLVLSTISAWFDVAILPQVQSATTDGELIEALHGFDFWAFSVYDLLVLPITGTEPVLVARRRQWIQAIEPKLQQAIAGNNQLCAAQRSIAALQNVFYWHSWATVFGLDVGALQRGRVLEQLCAKLVVRNVRLPNPVQAGFPNDLDAEFALQFGANPTLVPIPVSVAFSGTGPTFAKSSPSNSDANGAFTVALTARNNDPFSVSLIGCLVMPGASDVCALETVNGASLDLTGAYTGSFSSSIRTANGSEFAAVVPVNIRLTQTQNGISGTYEVMEFNGPTGTLSATLSATELLNFTLTQQAPCIGSFRGTATITVATRRIQSLYAGSDCSGTHTNGISDILPGTLTTRTFAGTWVTGFHSSGRPLGVWVLSKGAVDISLSYSELNTTTLELQCAGLFKATPLPGADGFVATLNTRFGTLNLFADGATVTWSPDPSRIRGAFVQTARLGRQTAGFVSSSQQICP